MKIIKKGNVYKKASWFKEHEEKIFIVGCIIIGLIGLSVKFNSDLEDFQIQVAIERNEQNKKIEEMEEQIRILEQENYILKYGYENEKE